MASVVDLCRNLGIKHPGDFPTCIGYGKAKPTCGNLVAAATRAEAASRLAEICISIRNGTQPDQLTAQLTQVAELLHCKRWHRYQGQGQAKAQMWVTRLTATTVSANETYGHQQGQARIDSHRRPYHPATLTRTRIDTQLQGQALNSTVASLDEQQGSRHSRRSSPTPRMGRPGPWSDRMEYSPQPSVGEREDQGSQLDNSSSRRPARPSASRSPLRSGRSSSHSSHSLPTSLASSSPRTSQSGILANSDTECGICLSMVTEGSKWSCRICRNSTHAECFDEWVATSLETGVRCIYCRASVEI